MSIHFRKLYQRVHQGDLDYAIVGFSKGKWYIQDGKVVQWSYNLVIDLWLFKIAFRWLYPKISLDA
jgi:hypothetical protein